jgi:hypothetical protein
MLRLISSFSGSSGVTVTLSGTLLSSKHCRVAGKRRRTGQILDIYSRFTRRLYVCPDATEKSKEPHPSDNKSSL